VAVVLKGGPNNLHRAGKRAYIEGSEVT